MPPAEGGIQENDDAGEGEAASEPVESPAVVEDPDADEERAPSPEPVPGSDSSDK